MKRTCDRCEHLCDESNLHSNDFTNELICDNCLEADYDRAQERLMEDGPGKSLLEQQIEADNIRKGRRS